MKPFSGEPNIKVSLLSFFHLFNLQPTKNFPETKLYLLCFVQMTTPVMIITTASAASVVAVMYVFKVEASETGMADTAVNRNFFNF